MTELVIFVLIFVVVGAGFLAMNLVVGKLVRPDRPNPEKEAVYECGEPTIGSSWIQFDLRFYVVALLFVIFDVEIAFFFPWGTVFGSANKLARDDISVEQRAEIQRQLIPDKVWAANQRGLDRRAEAEARSFAKPPAMSTKGIMFGKQAGQAVVEKAPLPPPETGPPPREVRPAGTESLEERLAREGVEAVADQRSASKRLAWLAFADIGVFFGVLLVGFAYLWKRGDLDWVRSTAAQEHVVETPPSAPAGLER
jgi:NADH-quinone oxidoreductase subunit A